MTYSLPGGCITFPNIATNWGSGVQKSEPEADISHSKHDTKHPQRRYLHGKSFQKLSGKIRYTGGLMGDKNVHVPQFNYQLGLANLKLYWIASFKIPHLKVLVHFPHLQGLCVSAGFVIINSTSVAVIYLAISHQYIKHMFLYTEGNLFLWDVNFF